MGGIFSSVSTLDPSTEVKEACKPFVLTHVELRNIMGLMLEQLQLGLNIKTQAQSSLKCYNTFVQDLPTGNENGNFLVLELGTTQCRIHLINLSGRQALMKSKNFIIPEHLKIGSAESININIVAIMNNTTATLLASALTHENCKVSLILGSGTNLCYVERVKNLIGFSNPSKKKIVLINTEWGNFGEKGELNFIRTKFDHEIDKGSINPGHQIVEKMIAALYIGELVRLIIVALAKEQKMFRRHKVSKKLLTSKSFLPEYISEIESDKIGTFKNCRKIFAKLEMKKISDHDCVNVRYICECVSQRCASLAAAGIATIANKINQSILSVATTGSLLRFHPNMKKIMEKKVKELVSQDVADIEFVTSEEGGSRGAAFVAAAYAPAIDRKQSLAIGLVEDRKKSKMPVMELREDREMSKTPGMEIPEDGRKSKTPVKELREDRERSKTPGSEIREDGRKSRTPGMEIPDDRKKSKTTRREIPEDGRKSKTP